VLGAVGSVLIVTSTRGSLPEVAGCVLILVSMMILVGTVPPTSKVLLRVAATGLAINLIAVAAYSVSSAAAMTMRLDEFDCDARHGRMWVYIHVWLVMGSVSLAGITGMCATLVRSCFINSSARELRDVVWFQLGIVGARLGIVLLYYVSLGLAVDRDFAATGFVTFNVSFGTALVLSSAVALEPRVRQRAAACLSARGESTTAAVAIASLIQNEAALVTITRAAARLRAISAADLTGDVFVPPEESSTTEVNKFYDRSTRAHLDAIDAFVSHSWHDDPNYKWEALQIWRREFKSMHGGREPLLWIDRCCIDQSSVLADLPNLPVYLAACRNLIILAGPTYLSRLWTVAEIFIYDQIRVSAAGEGASASVHAPRPPHQQTSFSHTPQSLRLSAPSLVDTSPVSMLVLPGFDQGAISDFSVEACTCTAAEDFDRLATAIEVGCGTLHAFNGRAIELLRGAHVHEPDLSHVQPHARRVPLNARPASFRIRRQVPRGAIWKSANSRGSDEPSRTSGASALSRLSNKTPGRSSSYGAGESVDDPEAVVPAQDDAANTSALQTFVSPAASVGKGLSRGAGPIAHRLLRAMSESRGPRVAALTTLAHFLLAALLVCVIGYVLWPPAELSCAPSRSPDYTLAGGGGG